MVKPPTAERARLPDLYGLPADSDVLGWSEIETRVATSQHYWVCTVDPGGAPVPRPVDAVWVDTTLHFTGHPESLWRRNLDLNRAASVHLPDDEHAVILLGTVSINTPDRALAQRLARASDEKYGRGHFLANSEGGELVMFAPTTVVAWAPLYANATRFVFQD